jgi:hypothetical protein
MVEDTVQGLRASIRVATEDDMRSVGLIATVLAGTATLAIGATLVLSLPDVRRYLTIRKM